MKALAEKERIVKDLRENKYSWISDSDMKRAFNYAVSDFVFYKYPSENNRPKIEELEIDFMNEQWICERMEDIVSRAGGSSVQSYSENGMNWEYATSHIEYALISKITPKAAVPR